MHKEKWSFAMVCLQSFEPFNMSSRNNCRFAIRFITINRFISTIAKSKILGLGWAAAGSVDGKLSFHRSLLVLHRAYVADDRVSAIWIVEPLDIIEHTGARLIACPIDFSSDALHL